jgi:hypothetical protein
MADIDQGSFTLRETVSTLKTPISARDPLVVKVTESFNRAQAGLIGMPEPLLRRSGMSGRKYRTFINQLIRLIDEPQYLEVGVHAGSTLCSAIWENDVTAVGIDNFVSYVVENPHWQMTIDPDTLVDPKRHLYENLKEFRGEARVEIIESDFRKVDYEDLGKASKFNVYMYDGPHKEQDQYDGITMALPALADKFVLIVDDWNWEQVRKGTMTATLDCEIDWLLGVEIMTQVIHDNQVQAHTFGAPYFFQNSDWHNGYFIGVYKRRE